ncbi:sigma-70 family RNA polymerase sigma factor [Geitlerinema sp. PCC 9228]|jgi:RNA polymerase sigma factor (sigma-70 family)|uniref:sigma-70 family RNA polymerase sigma factor n=1 Tax=Geitlerinema sp. PCC 9228 TaxID=111611 RepID=UPI00147CCAED|nr:sigma-70 family RNA polymerase sigma factor [Geitlerinema sp. PCC 9228]
MFSSFARFENDCFQQWFTEPVLLRNLQRQASVADLSAANRAAQDFWVLYWYRIWQQSSPSSREQLALGHLTAYLQESCYWVAQHTARQLNGVQFGVSDCFQIAIATVPTLLARYNPNQGASLSTYAGLCFRHTIRDVLRQQREVETRSDWGLLRKASQKQIVEALQALGLGSEQIANYRLVWMAYKTCWTDRTFNNRQLSRPDGETWQAIASFYNDCQGSAVSGATVERWLQDLAGALRRYLQPTVTSLNLPKFEGGGEWQDDFPAAGEDIPWVSLMRQEELQQRRQQKAEISDRLCQAVAAIDGQNRQLLLLYYGQNCTQQQIAEQLQLKQYTVSRRLSRIKQSLLWEIASWSQESQQKKLTSSVLKEIGMALEEWLQNHLQEHAMEGSLLKE